MHLTNMEMVNTIGYVIYAMSLVIYMMELFTDFKDNKPKVFSEWFWYSLLAVGGLVPVLNTVVSYQIIKTEKKDER